MSQNKESSFFFLVQTGLPWNLVCTNFQITVILKVTTQLLEGDKPIQRIFFYHQTSSTHKLAFIPSLQVQYFKLRQIWGHWQFNIQRQSIQLRGKIYLIVYDFYSHFYSHPYFYKFVLLLTHTDSDFPLFTNWHRLET